MGCLEAERERLNKEIDDLAELESAAAAAEAVQSLVAEANLSVIRWLASPPFVCINLYGVKNWKDSVPVLQNLASMGWHTDKDNVYSDYAEIDRRTYNLIGPGESKTGEVLFRVYRLRLMLFLANEGATCRKVQVGTKEEPVYEYQCA